MWAGGRRSFALEATKYQALWDMADSGMQERFSCGTGLLLKELGGQEGGLPSGVNTKTD